MQTYDLVMLAVLGGATIFGFWKGLAWQIASLASLVVSYFVALKFADRIAPMVSSEAPWNKFVAMLIVYAACSLAIWLAFRLVAGAIDRVRLNEFDRQMGALVGFGKGVLYCIAITFFAVTLTGQQNRERIIGSRSGQYIVQILDKADSVAPPEIQQVIGPYIEQISRRLDPNYQPNPQQDAANLQQLWEQAKSAGSATSTPSGQPGGVKWPTFPTPEIPPLNQPASTPATPISTGGNRR